MSERKGQVPYAIEMEICLNNTIANRNCFKKMSYKVTSTKKNPTLILNPTYLCVVNLLKVLLSFSEKSKRQQNECFKITASLQLVAKQ